MYYAQLATLTVREAVRTTNVKCTYVQLARELTSSPHFTACIQAAPLVTYDATISRITPRWAGPALGLHDNNN